MVISDGRYDVNVQLDVEADHLPLAQIEQAAIWVLDAHNVAAGTGLSVVITADEEVRRLNRVFRAVDAPTDVLSFPADPVPVPQIEPYLGDLILGLPYIRRQAEAENHSLSDELVLAVVHGMLHLLGYDHDTPAHQAAMWEAQDVALGAMNVAISVPLFEFDDDAPDESGLDRE